MESLAETATPKERLSKSVDTLPRLHPTSSLYPVNGARAALCQSTPELPAACRRSALPRQRSVWRRSLTRMKDDLSQFGRYLRRSFTDSSSDRSVVARIVPDIRCQQANGDEPSATAGSGPDLQRPPRRITIGSCSCGRGKPSRSCGRHSAREDGQAFDQPDHNFSSSLVLRSLEDGQFSAEISLRQLPPGDLLIQVRAHELEIVLERSPSVQDRRHRITVPSHQGVVELPIFVDESSLRFAQDARNDALLVYGRTKGCLSRRRSLSYSVLQSKADGRTFWKTVCRKLGFRRAKSHDSISRSQSMDDKAFKPKPFSNESVW